VASSRPSKARTSALNCLLAASLLSLSTLTSFAAPRTLLHKPAPPFARTSLDGQPIRLAAFKGHIVLLSFWATWCAPCQVEMPRFIDWQTRYASKGLQIVAVSMDDEQAPVRALTTERHVNYPVLMGDDKLARLYGGILGLPITFLIDRQGRIAAKFKGETNLDTMEQSVRRLLDKP
jgi:cytochrome c biogenesis protein CcmG/thiol:disulfide interchange protein DsbE